MAIRSSIHPSRLIPYALMAVDEGNVDPLKILEIAIEKSRKDCKDMIEQQTERAQLAFSALRTDFFESNIQKFNKL